MNTQQMVQILIDAGIEHNEARCEVKMLAEHFCGYTELDKLRGIELSQEQTELLYKKVQERVNYRLPVQYITGEAWFMGEYYKVTPDVLIPRDETEILVKKAIEIIKENKFTTVLDIGTGSGCIACSIAKNTDATVLGVDISTDALRVALDNVTKLGINNKAVFRKSDLFTGIREDECFDLIISNPPYIPEGTELDAEVMHEPHIALFAANDGLWFYEKIIKHASHFLNNNGYLMFELGINEAEAVSSLMSAEFENIEIIKDMSGIDRVIIGELIK